MKEIWVQWVRSQGWEDTLVESMATHSSVLAWRTPWTEEPGGLGSMWLQRVIHDVKRLSTTHALANVHASSVV